MQDSTRSLLSYIVAYYLRHFDEVSCFAVIFALTLYVFFILFSSPPSLKILISCLLRICANLQHG